jgi:hypothetical protein
MTKNFIEKHFLLIFYTHKKVFLPDNDKKMHSFRNRGRIGASA